LALFRFNAKSDRLLEPFISRAQACDVAAWRSEKAPALKNKIPRNPALPKGFTFYAVLEAGRSDRIGDLTPSYVTLSYEGESKQSKIDPGTFDSLEPLIRNL
jgi:hypothetical protein